MSRRKRFLKTSGLTFEEWVTLNGRKPIVDVTGLILTPGNGGKDCMANGENGYYECCCDECDYLICCTDENYPAGCKACAEPDCPRRIK